jgi:D-alanyl-D-alanine dipeptidase
MKMKQERLSLLMLFFFSVVLIVFVALLPNFIQPISLAYQEELKPLNIYRQSSIDDAISIRREKLMLSALDIKFQKYGLVNIQDSVPEVLVSLKYSSTDNFMKKDMYGTLLHCYLHPDVVKALKNVVNALKKKSNDLRLIIYDGARPRSVQQMMWDSISKVDHLKKYVANPNEFSAHNYGLAVDITLCDTLGNPLDMGTPYDYFGEEANITNEKELVANKKISPTAYENRLLLRDVMTIAGFQTISSEWWHFSYPPNKCKSPVSLIP